PLRKHFYRIPEQRGRIEWDILLTRDNGQPGIAVPTQECLPYIDIVVLETTSVSLKIRIREVFSREAKPAKEAGVKFDVCIQEQFKPPARAGRYVIAAVRAGRQRGSRIPQRRARRREWDCGRRPGLFSLFLVPFVTQKQVPSPFQFLYPGCQQI